MCSNSLSSARYLRNIFSVNKIRLVCVFLNLFVASVYLNLEVRAQTPDSVAIGNAPVAAATLGIDPEAEVEDGLRDSRGLILDFKIGKFFDQANLPESIYEYHFGIEIFLKKLGWVFINGVWCPPEAEKPFPPGPPPPPPPPLPLIEGFNSGGQLAFIGGLRGTILKLGKLDLIAKIGAGVQFNSEGSLDDRRPNVVALEPSVDPVIHVEGGLRLPAINIPNGPQIGIQATISSITTLWDDTSYLDVVGVSNEFDAGAYTSLQFGFGTFIKF